MRNSVYRLCLRLAFVFLSAQSVHAHAAFVDFDDLVPVYDPYFSCFCDNPLTDQYASMGLMIDNAYLNGGSNDGGLTYENILLSGPYTQLTFINTLPTFVSMYVTSVHDDAIFLTAYGPGGFIEQHQTPGFAGLETDPPSQSDVFVSFSSITGISSINIDSFYFLRTGAAIDNLTFTYASVSEPHALFLLILSFTGLLLRRFKSGVSCSIT